MTETVQDNQKPGYMEKCFISLYSNKGDTTLGTNQFDRLDSRQELRVTSKPDNKLQWLAGVFYSDQDTPRHEDFFLGDTNLVAINLDDRRRDYGVFGEVSWPFTESLTGTVGVRWYDVSKSNHSVTNGITTDFQDVVTQWDYDESGVTPKFSLSWDINEGVIVYALASQGYRAGGPVC